MAPPAVGAHGRRYTQSWRAEISLPPVFAAYVALLEAGSLDHHNRVMAGVPVRQLLALSAAMSVEPEKLLRWIGSCDETAKYRLNANAALTAEEGDCTIGLERLVGLVAKIAKESCCPEEFNAAHWIGRWLDRPNPALGGRIPADFLRTEEARQHVESLIRRMQSGAYS